MRNALCAKNVCGPDAPYRVVPASASLQKTKTANGKSYVPDAIRDKRGSAIARLVKKSMDAIIARSISTGASAAPYDPRIGDVATWTGRRSYECR